MKLEYRRLGNESSETGILFCHGFGANMFDLCDLSGWMDPLGNAAWYFPQAPYALSCSGYAWFPQDEKKQNDALYGSYFSELESLDDPGRIASLESLEEFCTAAPHKRWILGGFSQGSMIALHLAARSKINTKSVILYSSAPFAVNALDQELALNGVNWKYLQTHGIQDQILSIENARRLHNHLQNKGIQGDFIEFNGYHQIPGTALSASIQLINEGLHSVDP